MRQSCFVTNELSSNTKALWRGLAVLISFPPIGLLSIYSVHPHLPIAAKPSKSTYLSNYRYFPNVSRNHTWIFGNS